MGMSWVRVVDSWFCVLFGSSVFIFVFFAESYGGRETKVFFLFFFRLFGSDLFSTESRARACIPHVDGVIDGWPLAPRCIVFANENIDSGRKRNVNHLRLGHPLPHVSRSKQASTYNYRTLWEGRYMGLGYEGRGGKIDRGRGLGRVFDCAQSGPGRSVKSLFQLSRFVASTSVCW